MKLLKAQIKNFYSIREMEIDYTKYEGLVYVDKKNKDSGASNGAGGSTSLVESICFGLFGRTVRKSKEDAFVNAEAKKNCQITLWIYDEVHDITARIVRKKRPSSLEFWWGEENLTRESVNDTQAVIEEMLGIEYKTFLSSAVFGQHNDVEFLAGSAEEKRVIIRRFLNLEDIFSMRDKIRDLKSKFLNEVKRCDAIINDTNDQVASIDNKLNKIQKLKEDLFIKSGYTSEDLTRHSLEEIIELDDLEERLILNLEDFQNEQGEILSLIDELQDQIGKGEYSNEIECFACGAATVEEQTKKNIKNLKQKIRRLNQKLAKSDEEKAIYSDELKNLPKFVPLKDYKKVEEYNKLVKESNTLGSFKEKHQSKIDSLSENRKENAKNYEIMRFWEIAFSEQGLIQYIIKNILDFFNQRVSVYLSTLTSDKYMIYFDEKLEEKIFVNGQTTYYMSLSGGEKKKIDLAVLLALQDLLKLTGAEQSNILFFDEIAENLDEESVQSLYILMQELISTENRTIFCITHNKYLKSLLESESKIKFEKKDNVTRLVA